MDQSDWVAQNRVANVEVPDEAKAATADLIAASKSAQLGIFDRAGSEASTAKQEQLDAPVEWAGMPRFVRGPERITLVLAFDSEADRDELIAQLGVFLSKKTKGAWSAWWPPREREDLASLRFDFEDDV